MWHSDSAESKADYYHEVADEMAESEEEMDVPMTRASDTTIDDIARAFRMSAAAAQIIESTPAIEDEEEGEDDDDDDDDDGDDASDSYSSGSDDDLGPRSAGDRLFAASLAAAAGSQPIDLLASILQGQQQGNKGGGDKRHETNRYRTDETESKQEGEQLPHALTTIADDTLDIQIYSDSLVDCDLPIEAAIIKLTAIRLAAHKFLDPYTADYIWHKDALDLRICSPAAHACTRRSTRGATGHSTQIPHLHASVCFGENIADEWYLLWLLVQLSSHFPSLSICARDSDGEPLAIEVAEHLPKGMEDPDKSKNKVWIRRGLLHLIPAPRTPAELDHLPVRPTVDAALRVLRDARVQTRAEQEVQQAMLNKMAPFVQASLKTPFQLDNTSLSAPHHARVLLPISLAALLKVNPQLVAEWTINFFYRDQLDMKRANKMDYILCGGAANRTHPGRSTDEPQEEAKMMDLDQPDGPPHPQPINASQSAPQSTAAHSSAHSTPSHVVPFVWSRVRFTHCLFAQLLHQKFTAPKVLMRAITSSLGGIAQGPSMSKAVDLGVKLTVGAEMWIANKRSEVARRVQRVAAARKRHPEGVADRIEIVNIARKAQQHPFESMPAVDAFMLAHATASIPLAPSWSAFKAELDLYSVRALFASRDDHEFGRTVALHLLSGLAVSHECLDLDGDADDLIDPLERCAFDIQQRTTVENVAQLPTIATTIQMADAIFRAVDDTDALAKVVPSVDVAGLIGATFSSLPADDSEDWLVIDPATLDRMMQEHSGFNAQSSSSSSSSSVPGSCVGSTIVDGMTAFVTKQSGIEGVDTTNMQHKSAKKSSTDQKEKKVRMDLAPMESTQPGTTVNQPKSILKKTDTPITSERPPAHASINIDPDELMRLLKSAMADPSAFAFSSTGGMGDFNDCLVGGASSSSSSSVPLQSQLADPDSDSDLDADDAAMLIDTDTGSVSLPRGTPVVDVDPDEDPYPPTAANTRPPNMDAFAHIFGRPKQTPPHQDKPDMVKDEDIRPTDRPTSAPNAAADSQAADQANNNKPKITDYMDAMDQELQQAGLHSSFEVSGESSAGAGVGVGPVDVNVNLLSNLLQSHAAESDADAIAGAHLHAGPVTTIMASMGINMPQHNP